MDGVHIASQLPSSSLPREFQPETLRAIVSITVQYDVLLTQDRTVAKQGPSNIFFGTAFPIVEHFGNCSSGT